MFPSEENLTPGERRRYGRHLLLPEIGAAGQARLKESSALIVGIGGLGCPAATYLAAAGVGKLTLLDDDFIDESNLQRQTLYSLADVGQPKVEVAARALRAQNPLIEIQAQRERLTEARADALLAGFDVIINGADNFEARYAVNDACGRREIPWVHGALHRFDAEVSVFAPGGPCYRCLHPTPPAPGEAPSCALAGVLGVLPGIVGSLMATEALKILLGIGQSLAGRVLLVDALTMRFREVRLQKNCPHERVDTTAIQCTPMKEITPTELKAKIDAGEKFALIDVREPAEWEIGHIEGAVLVPLATVPERSREWDQDEETIVMCRSGRRSADAIAYLAQQGFTNLANLRGGILAWSDDVDPRIPRY